MTSLQPTEYLLKHTWSDRSIDSKQMTCCHIVVIGVGAGALRTAIPDVDYAGAAGALIQVAGDNELTIEEANRVGEIVTEMINDNALVIWGARVNPQQEGRLKVTLVMTDGDSPNILSGFGTIAPQLFNMEPDDEPEMAINIDVDLYQMENF